jgi:hypothetical protein
MHQLLELSLLFGVHVDPPWLVPGYTVQRVSSVMTVVS